MSFPTVDNVYAGESSVVDMAYIDPYLFTSSFGGYPSFQPKIHKINPVTYEKVGEWAAPAGSCLSHSFCTDCFFLYIGMSSCPSPYRPIHVYKVNPETMDTVASWTSPTYRSQQWAEAMAFDFNSNRLLVVEDGSGGSYYRIYKLKQDLTLDMYKDANEGAPYYQYHGNDITIMDDYCHIATGGTPGQIVKRKLSDLSLVDYFEGFANDPDDYIEGIFFNLCNDGRHLYTATYDYSEERPTRLIKVNPADMSRVGTYYGAADELMGYGSYAYGGRIYMLLQGWNGMYGDEARYGETILQINPTTMSKTARYVNWTDNYNAAYTAVGDGSRLHAGYWGDASRSVLQFAELGTELCAICGKIAVGDKVMLCPIGTCYGDNVALKSGKADVSHKALIASLNNQAALKLAFRNCKSSLNDKVVCTPVGRTKRNLLAVR